MLGEGGGTPLLPPPLLPFNDWKANIYSMLNLWHLPYSFFLFFFDEGGGVPPLPSSRLPSLTLTLTALFLLLRSLWSESEIRFSISASPRFAQYKFSLTRTYGRLTLTLVLVLYPFWRMPSPINHFPDIGQLREWHCSIQREKVSGITLMSVWKKKLHLVTSSLFREPWRLTVSEKIQTSVIGLGLTWIWKESWNCFLKKCLQAFIAPQSPKNCIYIHFLMSYRLGTTTIRFSAKNPFRWNVTSHAYKYFENHHFGAYAMSN